MAVLVAQHHLQGRRGQGHGPDVAHLARHDQGRMAILQRGQGVDVLDGQAHRVHRQPHGRIGAGGLGPEPHHVSPEHRRHHQDRRQPRAHAGPDRPLHGGLAHPLVGLSPGPEGLGQNLALEFGGRLGEKLLVGRGRLRRQRADLGIDPEVERTRRFGPPGRPAGAATDHPPFANRRIGGEIAGGALWTGQYHGRRIGRHRRCHRGRRFPPPCPERQTPLFPAQFPKTAPSARRTIPSSASKAWACATAARRRCCRTSPSNCGRDPSTSSPAPRAPARARCSS